MKYSYQTKGTCSKSVTFDLQNGKVYNVQFDGGCSGNLQGIARLVEGMSVQEIIKKCSGIHCGSKDTSCPDQLARALRSVQQG